MDATERERLAALAEAATPGPWRVLHVHTPSTPTLDTPDLIAVTSDDLPDGYEVARVSTDYEDDPADVLADAAFIAAARQAVPALLAEVERLTSKYEEWDSMHAACEGLRGDLARVEAALAEAEAEVEAARRVAWRIALSLKDVEPVEELPKGYDIEEAWARFSSRVGIERLNAANATAERDRYRRQVEAVRHICATVEDNDYATAVARQIERALDGAES